MITNLQSENTGYFGNFKKCKELSNGIYFWLLSDNEHIFDGVIDIIIRTIHSNKENVGVYYLADLSRTRSKNLDNDAYCPEIFQTTFHNFIKHDAAYRLTSISSVILLNDKQFDEQVISKYDGNPFLGFLFLGNALRINDRITKISGRFYRSAPCQVYFDIFRAWTKDIMECVEYMKNCDLLSNGSEVLFVNGFLKSIVYDHVFYYCIHGELHGKSYGSRNKINILLDSYYNHNDYYRKHISPLFHFPGFILSAVNLTLRIKNKLGKLFRKLYY